ncbi:hypothetical protein vseg_012588 [Gypsophila vaccaria]
MTTNDAGATASSDQTPPENAVSTAAAADELRLLNDVVASLPPAAVKDLLHSKVCPQCVLRLLGKYGPSYCSSSSIFSLFYAVVGDELSGEVSASTANNDVSCSVCYGILEFTYIDEKQNLVKKDCAKDLAESIAELAKLEGHQVDGFTLEVSIPPIIMENDSAQRLVLKEKYGSEVWFQDVLQSESLSVKDVLKIFITEPLEKQLGVKSGTSSFRVRMTYTSDHPVKTVNGRESKQAYKKQKTDVGNGLQTGYGSDTCGNLQDKSSLSSVKVTACCLAIQFHRTPIFIGGRYLKLSRNVSQTRWIIDDERMGEASVEEILAGTVLPLCRGDNCKFHAAGREDIDVRMLGSGRPFLLEIQNPKVEPSKLLLKEMEIKINSSESKLVKVKNLKVVNDQGWTLMREGEAEKQKQYTALVWVSRELEDKDLETMSSLKDLQVLQRTPVRVLHRRSPLEREKIIHWMNIEKIEGSSQYFLLNLCTQAGTYIKEFVHGDLGRTQPNLGSILGCRAEILQLDVTDVKMDCFLSE